MSLNAIGRAFFFHLCQIENFATHLDQQQGLLAQHLVIATGNDRTDASEHADPGVFPRLPIFGFLLGPSPVAKDPPNRVEAMNLRADRAVNNRR